MELPHYQILHLFGGRCEDVRQASNLRFDGTCYTVFAVDCCPVKLVLLSNNKGKVEVQLIVIGKSKKERWRAMRCCFWILCNRISPAIYIPRVQLSYLYVINKTIIALLLLYPKGVRRKLIWRDSEDSLAARIGDRDASYRDCAVVSYCLLCHTPRVHSRRD